MTKYLEQSENNEQAARSIKDSYPDWAVTACFYAALHWVEHYASVRGCNIRAQYPADSPHDSRRDYVSDIAYTLGNRNLRKIYSNLEDESKKARYMMNLSVNAKMHYTQKKHKVTESFQDLQQLKIILKSN